MVKLLADLWRNPYLRFVLLLAALACILLLIFSLRQVIVAFAVAYLLSYLLNPLVTLIAKRFGRVVGVASVIFIFIFFLALLWLLGIRVTAQFSQFLVDLPELINMVQELPFRIGRWIDPQFGAIFQQTYTNLERLSRYLTNQLIPQLVTLGSGGRNPTEALVVILGGGAQAGIIIVLALYLLYNFPHYTRSFLRSFPHRHRPLIESLMKTAGESVGGYVRGQILIAIAVGILSSIGLSIVGVPLALALGVLAGIFNLIPFLGPLLTAIPTLLLALTEGTGQVIGATVVLILVNQIDAHILTPQIFARVISLDPLTVILVVLIGAALFGFVGALLAVPIAAFLKVMYSNYYLESAWYKRA